MSLCSLKRGGILLATDGLQNLFLSAWTTVTGDQRVRFPIPPRFTKKDVVFLKELIEAGGTEPSSTGATRWRRWSKQPGTSERNRRPGT